MARVAAVVLAAGASRRLGTPKQLLALDGRTVLDRTLDAVRRTRLDPRLVVLGHRADDIAAVVDLSGFVVVQNPAYAEGQSTSVRAGVTALPDDIEAAVFILGDQPTVAPEVIDRLVEAFAATRAPIVQPRYAEGRGNPVLIARALFSELSHLTGDTGARPLIGRLAERVALIDVPALHRPADIDTVEDFERLRTQFDAAHERDGA